MFSSLFARIRTLRFGLGTIAIAALNLLLAIILLAVVIRGTQADAILATVGKTKAAALIDIQVPTLASNLDLIQAQPIFHASRSFYVPPDPASLAVQLITPDYRIVGAMSLPSKPTIVFLLHNQSGTRTKVQRGDMLDGWVVDEASNQHVVLSQNGQHAEISTAKQPGTTTPGMQAAVTTTQTPSAAQGGIRILSGGTARSFPGANAGALPKGPPGGVGARLYRPPPGQ